MPQLEIIISATDTPEKIIDLGMQEGLLRALYATLNGVYRMSADIEGLGRKHLTTLHVLLLKRGKLK